MRNQGLITVTDVFPEGIIVDGMVYRDFTLCEELFRHSLEMVNDATLDMTQMNDDVYYQACLYARRLTVPGITVTPELVLALSGVDGRALIQAAAVVEQRRKAFRDAAEAAQVDAGGGVEAGTAV